MNEEFEERLRLLVPINKLTERHQEQVLSASEIFAFKKNDFIFRQGDRDNFAFYILEGDLEMYAGDQLIKKVSGGEGASFQALAQLQPRQMSAQAKSKVKVLRVDRVLLDQLLSVKDEPAPLAQEIEVSNLEDNVSADWLTQMLQSALFANVPPSNIQRLLDILETFKCKAGDTVITQGDVGDYYYAIQSGRCEVLRTASSNKQIRIAELGPGARFGEESLVSNAKRNATVRMVTDGELARLQKEDFIELIKKPVLNTCTLPEARALVEDGAQWLDVRFPEEHASNGIAGSKNIPLSFLRNKTNQLDPTIQYVTYCDTGGRSSAAAFLLTQAGIPAIYVENGAISEIPIAQESKSATIQTQVEKRTIEESEKILEANVRAESLNADVEKANLQIERAQKLMAEAEAAKREADKIVEQKLQEARAKLMQEAADIEAAKREVKKQAENTLRLAREQLLEDAEKIEKEKAEQTSQLEEQLRAERARLAEETKLVETKLEEAKALKEQLENQQQAAELDVKNRIEEQQNRITKLQAESDQRMREKEKELESLYLKQADELEKLQTLREESQNELTRARQEIQAEQDQSKERLDAVTAKESSLAKEYEQRQNAFQVHEQQMRDKLQEEIDRERQVLEREFTKSAEAMEKAETEKRAAIAAREAAAAEAQRMIEEYKQEHNQKFAEQERKLAEKRKTLEDDSRRLENEILKASQAREEAEALKRATEAQLAAAADKQAASDDEEALLRREIEMIEQRAKQANAKLKAAIAIETAAESKQREHEQNLEKTYNTHNEMNILLQNELDEWVTEQEKLQESTAQQNALAQQRKIIERIKSQSVQAKQSSKQHDNALLDEIASQLEP